MKKHEGLFQKVFGGIGYGSRVPLRSNVFSGGGGRGYSPIGGTANRMFSGMRESPLLGNASPSNRLSMYYQRVDELRVINY
jgi:hypothetical protein